MTASVRVIVFDKMRQYVTLRKLCFRKRRAIKRAVLAVTTALDVLPGAVKVRIFHGLNNKIRLSKHPMLAKAIGAGRVVNLARQFRIHEIHSRFLCPSELPCADQILQEVPDKHMLHR